MTIGSGSIPSPVGPGRGSIFESLGFIPADEMGDSRLVLSSWRGLAMPSTSLRPAARKDVDGGPSPAMTGETRHRSIFESVGIIPADEMGDSRLVLSSWRGSATPYTSLLPAARKDVDGGPSPAMTGGARHRSIFESAGIKPSRRSDRRDRSPRSEFGFLALVRNYRPNAQRSSRKRHPEVPWLPRVRHELILGNRSTHTPRQDKNEETKRTGR